MPVDSGLCPSASRCPEISLPAPFPRRPAALRPPRPRSRTCMSFQKHVSHIVHTAVSSQCPIIQLRPIQIPCAHIWISRVLTSSPCAPHTSRYMACVPHAYCPIHALPARGQKIARLRTHAGPAMASLVPEMCYEGPHHGTIRPGTHSRACIPPAPLAHALRACRAH